MNTGVTLLETFGPSTASSEHLVSQVHLSADDLPSTALSPLRRNANGAPVYSCERWLRLRFDMAHSETVTGIRFWFPGLDLEPGWRLTCGTSRSYASPTRTRSSYAILPVTATDPGENAPNLVDGQLTGPAEQFTPYLVLQALVVVEHPGPIQAAPLNLRFAWRRL